jgi:hypothetical protein
MDFDFEIDPLDDVHQLAADVPAAGIPFVP